MTGIAFRVNGRDDRVSLSRQEAKEFMIALVLGIGRRETFAMSRWLRRLAGKQRPGAPVRKGAPQAAGR